MQQGEIAGFMKALAPVIGDFVVKAIEPLRAEVKRLLEEVAALKLSHEALPKAIDEASVGRLVDERVAKIPPALPGKDADSEMVAVLVAKAVAALEIKGERGTSVTVDDVAPMIDEVVARHVAALPAPVPGKSVTIDDVRPILQEMVDAIEKPKNGESVTVDDVVPMIEREVGKAVAGLDLPKPDEALVALIIGEKVDAVLATWERPQDGTPGKSVTVEDLAPMVEAEAKKAVAALPVPKDGIGLAGALIDREGQLVVTMTDGTARELGIVVGKDVDLDAVAATVRGEVAKIPVPKDGVDGVGFDDMDLVDIEGDLFLRFTRGEVVKDFHLPVPTDRGVWVEREFRKGAGVTWGGSFWMAQRDTSAKPDTADSGWRLAIKRGRDGASAFDVARKAGFRGSEREWLDSLRPGPVKPVKVN